MATTNNDDRLRGVLVSILPTVHLVLIIATLFLAKKGTVGGNPFFCIDLPWSLPLVGRDDWATILVVAILGTLWWYVVARIGWGAKKHQFSRIGSGLGAGLLFFVCGIDAFAGSDFFLQFLRHPLVADVLEYLCAGILLVGGLVCAIYSVLSAFRKSSGDVQNDS